MSKCLNCGKDIRPFHSYVNRYGITVLSFRFCDKNCEKAYKEKQKLINTPQSKEGHTKEELQSKVEALEKRVQKLEPTKADQLSEALKTIGALMYIAGFLLLCYSIAKTMMWI